MNYKDYIRVIPISLSRVSGLKILLHLLITVRYTLRLSTEIKQAGHG